MTARFPAFPAFAAVVTRLMGAARIRLLREDRSWLSRALSLACKRMLALLVGIATTTAFATSDEPNRIVTSSPASQSVKSETPAEQSPRRTGERVTSLCVDADGKPVSGAEVHLFQLTGGASGRFVHTGPVASDAQGKAVCAPEIFRNEQGNFDRWFYARVPGRLVGVARAAKWTNRAAFNREGRVKLMASRSIEGRVTVPAGFDPTKVVVRVRTLHIFTGPAEMNYQSLPRHDDFPGLDTALSKIFDCRPDTEGRLHFGDVPVRGRLYVVTAGDGLAEAQWMNQSETFDQPIHLTIEEESLVSGRVLAPDGKPLAAMEVTARLSPLGGGRNVILTSFRGVTDGNGHFAIHGLPQTKLVLSIQDPNNLWTFRPLETPPVRPGNDPHLMLTLEAGTMVSGKVFDAEGKPVQAASLSAVSQSQVGSGLAHDFTDATGRYQLRLPAGGARLYFDSLLDGFAYPHPQVVKELDIKAGQADIQNMDLTIQRRVGPSQ